MNIFLKKKNKNQERGFVALISVLVLGAVGLYITISALETGISSSLSLSSVVNSTNANTLANACVEEALQQIRDDTAYVGSGNLSLTLGACEYTVINTGGESRRIDSEGVMDETVRRVRVFVSQINPQIVVTSWQEIADF